MTSSSVESLFPVNEVTSKYEPNITSLAYAPKVLDTVENLIAPGLRMRLSPYIEAVQFEVIFGAEIDQINPARRYADMQRILDSNNAKIETIAQSYVDFEKHGKNFSPSAYTEPFLSFYLAYYLTTNACKLQLTLLELARQGRLRGDYTLIDIGVGAGTTAVATMDFLLAWATVCNLHGIQIPVGNIQLVGYDANQMCLDFAARVCTAYAHATTRRYKSLHVASDIKPSQITYQWADRAEWRLHDLEQDMPSLPTTSVIVVISNVLSELTVAGKHNVGNLLKQLRNNSVAIVIEPGDEKRTTALNAWRRKLLPEHPGLLSLGPCGQEFASVLPAACDNCWNGRRESLHESLLHRRISREIQSQSGQRQSVDEYENNLLSWSYCLLGTHAASKVEANSLSAEVIGVREKDTVTSRYVGKYKRRKSDIRSEKQLVPHDPDATYSYAQTDFAEFIKLCPGTKKSALELARPEGIVLPRLAFGEPIMLSSVNEKEREANTFWLTPKADEDFLYRQISIPRMYTDLTSHFLSGNTPLFRESIDELAYRLFGFHAMQPFQHRILERVLSGHNILGIAATGGGKSECYILPALVLPGITIVVSPLKSLMQDQCEERLWKRYGLKHLATYINSDTSFGERQTRLKRLELGYYKIFYVTPEQLERNYVLDAIKRADEQIGIRYLAFDEAHCISHWGHDFRPSYLNIVRRLRDWNIRPLRIALTATASPKVVEDICDELELLPNSIDTGGDVYIDSSNRPELNLIVRVHPRTEDKIASILNDLRKFANKNTENKAPGAAIVFMPHTGKRVNRVELHSSGSTIGAQQVELGAGATEFAVYLQQQLEMRVALYHSKMEMDNSDHPDQLTENTPEEISSISSVDFSEITRRTRRGEQDAFINGTCDIMVATKGFGMGIDKSNIRLVIHRTPPINLEAYVQEAGRAGRDGEIANAILYYSPDRPSGLGKDERYQSDQGIQEFFLKDKYVRRVDVYLMYSFLKKVTRQVGQCIYFTNDEAIEYFDQHQGYIGLESLGLKSFEWPSFPRLGRDNNGKKEFAEILERGHLYQNKTDYIDRIMTVLYKTRPTVDGRKRISFLESVHTAGTRIVNLRIVNAAAILHSNSYFGRLFRDKNMDVGDLVGWLRRCTEDGVLEFARFLELSLKETNALLWDINRSDGNFVRKERQGAKRWNSNLVNFDGIAPPKYGPASGKDTKKKWMDYAGAWKREYNAYERARKEGRSIPNIDDYFPWRMLCKSKGWEVELGDIFKTTVNFGRYLDEFDLLQKQRETNNREAYHLLLTDYIGVPPTGALGQVRKRNCLRNVMLGYLKTGEAVVGGNCRSCSNCVRDGNFEPDMEIRRQLVKRLPEDFWRTVQKLEAASDELPPSEIIDTFWKIVTGDAKLQRSLLEYTTGWTNRVLQDTPDHRTARWIRVTGMSRDLLDASETELVQHLEPLLKFASTEETKQIESILDTLSAQYVGSIELQTLRAKLLYKMQRYRDCVRAWLRVADLLEEGDDDGHRKIYSLLSDIFSPTGHMPNPQLYKICRCRLVRRARDVNEAEALLRWIIPRCSWKETAEEIEALKKTDWFPSVAPQVILWWLISHKSGDEITQAITELDSCLDVILGSKQAWEIFEHIESIPETKMPGGVSESMCVLRMHVRLMIQLEKEHKLNEYVRINKQAIEAIRVVFLGSGNVASPEQRVLMFASIMYVLLGSTRPERESPRDHSLLQA